MIIMKRKLHLIHTAFRDAFYDLFQSRNLEQPEPINSATCRRLYKFGNYDILKISFEIDHPNVLLTDMYPKKYIFKYRPDGILLRLVSPSIDNSFNYMHFMIYDDIRSFYKFH